MLELFRDSHVYLELVPGPMNGDTFESTIWVAGGGRGEARVLRFGADGWHSLPSAVTGLRDVLPLSAEQAMICGEHGYLATVTAAGDETPIELSTNECMFALARLPDGQVVCGGDQGVVFHVVNGQARRRWPGILARIADMVVDGTELYVAAANGLYRMPADGDATLLWEAPAPLTRIARGADGTFAVTGDANQLYLWRAGDAVPTRITVDDTAGDLETLAWASDHFIVGGSGGRLFTLAVDGTLMKLPAFERTITMVVPWRDGALVGGWHQTGAPYKFRGVIGFLGPAESAPAAVRPRPHYPVPQRRERTVALGVGEFLGPDDGNLVTYEEAKARVPNVTWPESGLTRVRLFEGNVRVARTRELFAGTEPESSNYAVAITGSLVVDGPLDACAGGDGYDSVLVVGQDVWADAAVFRGGIKASIGGTLEVATVVACSHGDDGGTLWAGRIRAQVVAYSLYFPRPDGELDAVSVGDVYGETGELPEARANEVFRPDVLDEGAFDENAMQDALLCGRPVLLD